ncbi:MAG: hypothetical protein OEY01_06925 [Desulfobulbaceae bacterium]|nr:hypothetical protein [Desulfobulbaceae bacterium]HIJ78790.1 hypothetical protein [Deltaproteobacteria bacterium]
MNSSTTKTTTKATATTQTGVNVIAKGSVAVIGGVSAIIGIWAVSCLISAAYVAGPIGLIKGWFTAVAGL